MAIALSSLNTTAISYGMLEKIPFSGAGDPGNTILALGNKIRGATIVAVEYGSASNQASVISAAITAASNGDVLVFGTGVIKIETAITCTKNISFIGTGGTIFRTTSNITILNCTGTGVRISGIQFEGNSTGAAQTGLVLNTGLGFTVENCNFKNLLLAGGTFGGGSQISPYTKNIVRQCRADNCGIGFDATGSYYSYTDCDASLCGNGFKITTANMTLMNCSANAFNTNGLLIDAASGGKTTIYGGHFNHGISGNSININQAPNGVVIHGVNAVIDTIAINADRVHFIGCQLAGGSSNMNSKNVLFMGNTINTGGLTLTNKTNCVFVNNYDLSNVLWTG